MTPVRFGLVGYGFGARYFHAPLLVAAPECEVVGVMTSSAERQALVAREMPGAPTVTSLQALVDAGAEAVAISTPAETHSAVTDAALQLGLAVVCDKPFAMDPAAARQSVALAEERGLKLSPYQNRRWDADFLTVRKVVDSGEIGTVTRLSCGTSAMRRSAARVGPAAGRCSTSAATSRTRRSCSLVQRLGVRRAAPPRERPRRRCLHRGDTRERCALAALGELAPVGARTPISGHRHHATYVLAAGDTQENLLLAGETPQPLATAGVSSRLIRTGPCIPGQRRAVCDRARTMGSLLPGVRGGRSRHQSPAGGSPRCHREPHAARRGENERRDGRGGVDPHVMSEGDAEQLPAACRGGPAGLFPVRPRHRMAARVAPASSGARGAPPGCHLDTAQRPVPVPCCVAGVVCRQRRMVVAQGSRRRTLRSFVVLRRVQVPGGRP